MCTSSGTSNSQLNKRFSKGLARPSSKPQPSWKTDGDGMDGLRADFQSIGRTQRNINILNKIGGGTKAKAKAKPVVRKAQNQRARNSSPIVENAEGATRVKSSYKGSLSDRGTVAKSLGKIKARKNYV